MLDVGAAFGGELVVGGLLGFEVAAFEPHPAEWARLSGTWGARNRTKIVRRGRGTKKSTGESRLAALPDAGQRSRHTKPPECDPFRGRGRVVLISGAPPSPTPRSCGLSDLSSSGYATGHPAHHGGVGVSPFHPSSTYASTYGAGGGAILEVPSQRWVSEYALSDPAAATRYGGFGLGVPGGVGGSPGDSDPSMAAVEVPPELRDIYERHRDAALGI